MWVVRKLKKLISIPQVYTVTRNDYKEMKLVQYLRQWNPKLQQDEKWNLFLINPWTPLLCAHMDTRQNAEATAHNSKPWVLVINEWILKSWKCLWADDKCWVAIAMQIYEELGDEVSLLFTVQEESGLLWARYFVENNRKRLESCLYCVIPDRLWGEDIIGRQNDYCSLDFQSEVYKLTKDAGYKPARGICCDANAIKHVLNCVNMSCWYRYHHTDNEEVDIDEFYNAYVAIYNLVISMQERMPIFAEPVQQAEVERIKNKYTNNTTYKNRNKHTQHTLPMQYPDDVMRDIPWLWWDGYDWDYDEFGNTAFNRKELEQQNKYWCDVKVNNKKNLITFESDTEMLLKDSSWEIIEIPKWKYRFFKAYTV